MNQPEQAWSATQRPGFFCHIGCFVTITESWVVMTYGIEEWQRPLMDTEPSRRDGETMTEASSSIWVLLRSSLFRHFWASCSVYIFLISYAWSGRHSYQGWCVCIKNKANQPRVIKCCKKSNIWYNLSWNERATILSSDCQRYFLLSKPI